MPEPKKISTRLNAAQQEAVFYAGGHLLIMAGPGTGKTHTLIQRIVGRTGRLPQGQRILAVTFTRKAAQEMRERLSCRPDAADERVVVGTFHQFCLSFLKEHAGGLGLAPSFGVASPEKIELIAKELWPGKKRKDIRITLEEISHYKSNRWQEPAPEVVLRYNRCLHQRGLLDFDDLLVITLESLNHNDHPVFHDIFVDEYQDINPLQHALLKALLKNGGTLTAIGDPNQAIYGFRGSDVKFFQTFEEDFPGAVVKSLSDNYRSAPNILNASIQMIAPHPGLPVPALTARLYHEGRLTIHEAPTDKAEAEYVVHSIEKLIGGIGMFSQDSGRVTSAHESDFSFGDIAVLYRLNSQRFALKEAFDRLGIPYHVSGEDADAALDEADDVFRSNIVEPEPVAEKVALMTLHAAKGLEFPVVFIIGCEDDIIPLNLEGFGLDSNEERRLLYVGMTRAQERLYLTFAKRRFLYGRRRHSKASPFLADITEELQKEEQPALSRRKDRERDQIKFF